MSGVRKFALVVFCMLAAPAAANAAATVGPANPNPEPKATQAVKYGSGVLLFTAEAPGVQLTAPFDGVITSWQFYTDDVGQGGATAQLRTLLPTGGKGYEVTGAGPINPLPPVKGEGPTDHNVPHVFPTRVPIAAGETVGVSLAYEAGSFVLPVLPAVLGWKLGCFGGGCPTEVPAAGKSADAGIYSDISLAMNATLEPDADHDGYGDETQDGAKPPVATVVPPTVVIPPNQVVKKKCKKGKKLKHGKCKKKKHKKHKKPKR